MPYDHGVALGEAFINVRADLKPFAKDVEKGVKEILRAVEQRLAADAKTGGSIRRTMHQQASEGISDGLEEGFDRGAKRGTKKALSTGAKFFAALGNFADDGLSAIPTEVKAAIVVGVLAASAAIAPLLAGTISAAVTSGMAIGVVTGGVVLASQLRPVSDQFTALGRDILDSLRVEAQIFVNPLLKSASTIKDAFTAASDDIGIAFAQASLDVAPLTDALTGFIQQLLPGIVVAVTEARPLIETLAVALPKLGRDMATFFAILADGSPQAVVAFRDFFAVIGTLLIVTAGFIRLLSDLYYWLRVTSELMSGDTLEAIALLAEREQAAALATGEITAAVDTLHPALSKAAAEANAARYAISALLTEELRGVNATIDYQQAIDDLQKSIREGHRDFRVTTDQGRENLRRVEQAIIAAGQERDAAIANAAATGQSIDQINAAYLREIGVVEKVIGKNAQQDKTLKDLITTAKGAPKEVDIKVSTPGLEKAIIDWKRFGAAIQSAIHKLASAGAKAVSGGGGLQTAVQKYAGGGIASSPTLGLIAEAGYKEAVIPDPAVMPKRAMELSNRFGLTQMISDALGAGQTIVNVFIGSQRLEEIADYRIQANNVQQAQTLAYGPRP